MSETMFLCFMAVMISISDANSSIAWWSDDFRTLSAHSWPSEKLPL